MHDAPATGSHVHKEVALLVAVHGSLQHVCHAEVAFHHSVHFELADHQLCKVGQDGCAVAVKPPGLLVPKTPAGSYRHRFRPG